MALTKQMDIIISRPFALGYFQGNLYHIHMPHGERYNQKIKVPLLLIDVSEYKY